MNSQANRRPRLITTALLMLACAAQAAGAQPVPDTTAAWRYYPLEVGSTWEYRCLGDVCGGPVLRRTLTADTTIGGRGYVVRTSQWLTLAGEPAGAPEPVPLRFDTTSRRVVRWSDVAGADWPETCDLAAAFASRTDCHEGSHPDGGPDETEVAGSYGGRIYVGTAEVEVESQKTFDPADPADYPDELYAADLGYVQASGFGASFTLLYVRLPGVEHGTPVAIHPGAGTEAAASLKIAGPNPVDDEATLTVNLRHTTNVDLALFDVSGRQIASLAMGPLTAGTHRFPLGASVLAPGVYFVRLSYDAGQASIPFVRGR